MLDLNDKSTEIFSTSPLRCGDKLVTFDQPRVMGILNLTPDSFYDGGRYQRPDQFLDRAAQMLEDGADILDVGAVSTRPGAIEVPEEEETKRIIPALKLLNRYFPHAIISVDTFRASVARTAVEYGALIINDISAGSIDSGLFETVASLNVPYILMHMKGTPTIMQLNPAYEDVVNEVDLFFKEKLEKLQSHGIKQVILDPGFGFGKTVENNYTLLKSLPRFRHHGYPILVGVSRKSMINRLLKIEPVEALHASGVLHTLALLRGAHILRVHDVKEAKQVIKVVDAFRNSPE